MGPEKHIRGTGDIFEYRLLTMTCIGVARSLVRCCPLEIFGAWTSAKLLASISANSEARGVHAKRTTTENIPFVLYIHPLFLQNAKAVCHSLCSDSNIHRVECFPPSPRI